MTKIRRRKSEKAKQKKDISSSGFHQSKASAAILLIFIGLIAAFSFSPLILAQSGVLIPLPDGKPDAQKLMLAVMNVEITIDNQHAHIAVRQIFDNRTERTLEGKYLFSLPAKASIADFAVWDGITRVPGVMMEKRRANRIYGEIKQAQIDPGILQTTDETERQSGFSARVFPIMPKGTKRLEMEYDEDVPIENLISRFTFPLKPSYGESQQVGELNLKIRVVNDFPFAPLAPPENSPYPLQIIKSEPNEFIGEYHASNVRLSDDFAFDYQISVPDKRFSVVAYRAPERISAYDLRDPQTAEKTADGFFQAQAVFGAEKIESRSMPPKKIVLLLDTSLSMYGDKLARAVEAADFFLHSLSAEDEFNVILFGGETEVFASGAPPSGTTENVEKAMDFIKNSALGGGTNLKKALQAGVSEAQKFSDAADRQIVLVSDANPTLETVRAKEMSEALGNAKIKLSAFALGSDADENLLRELTEKTHGAFDSARETEDIALKLKIFFEKLSASGIENLALGSPDANNIYDVYPTGKNSFPGSNFAFVGRYRKPQSQFFSLSARSGAENINLSGEYELPEFDETHSFLPRLWARARVDALLRLMNNAGEREDYIAEIIRLSEKYKLVTPYTAFLAAPRALLRPRLIQPGDPVIRVKTDPSVKAVFAVLPFGETLPLKFLAAESVWEARFLAPVWMADGAYQCRLILTDANGKGYEETKTFVVDSRAPRVKVNLEKQRPKAGDTLKLKVSADGDTSRLTARIYGAKPVQLFWSHEEKTNVGSLLIPENLATGSYKLIITAEDFAHNQTTEEIPLEIAGRQ